MKKYLSTFAIVIFLIFGCTEQTTITSHEQSDQTNEPNWIVKLNSSGLGIETIHTASALIVGSKGGDVQLRKDIPGGPFGKIQIDSRLHIHAGSFSGSMTISTKIDDVNFITTFGPSYVFNRPLEYTLLLQGLDLTGVNPATVKFVYQAADGSIHQCQYSSIDVDLSRGKLKVNSAQIPHFSRYGFIN